MKKRSGKGLSYKSKDPFSKKIKKVVARNNKYSLELQTPKGLDSLLQLSEHSQFIQESRKFITSKRFWQQLKDISVDKSFLKSFSSLSCIRIVSGQINPLSVTGSKINGGRFNIGAPQLRSEFVGTSLFPAIYGAETLDCAIAEVGLPIPRNYKAFELKSKRSFELWDLKRFIETIEWPNLKSSVEEQPYGAAWIFQKVPALSQLLAVKLKSSGGDGIFYPSTKKSSELVYTLFLQDPFVDSADDLFTAHEVI